LIRANLTGAGQGVLPARARASVLPIAAVAAAFGLELASHPLEAVLALVLVPIGLAMPTATVGLLLFITVLIPFDVQNRLSLGGGAGTPGLLAVDVLLGLGLCRTAVLILRERLHLTVPTLIAWFGLLAILAALAHGVANGASLSAAGIEARCSFVGVGTFILAMPLLESSAARRRLCATLLALGLALGLWGIAQVVLHVPYTISGDVGVRPGINAIAASGGGQLQGGLYAFPIAVILAFAAIVANTSNARYARVLITVTFLLNFACVLLTYERSIWGATVAGCFLVAARTGRASWARVARWGLAGVLALLAYFVLSPSALSTSLGRIDATVHFQSDNSTQSRQVESAAVIHAIARHPVIGAGFGTTVTWGQRDQFATVTTSFTHEGYLWLSWKLGLPVAIALIACMLLAATRRVPAREPPRERTLRVGCGCALIASLLVCIVFPEFNALGVTALLGFAAACCCSGPSSRSSTHAARARWYAPEPAR
jgi:hypothetical protein